MIVLRPPPHLSTNKSTYAAEFHPLLHRSTRRRRRRRIPSVRSAGFKLVAGVNGGRSSRGEFAQFVAREARFDNEYWAAARLRAESYFEGRKTDRYIGNYKQMFAEQEFNQMKRRRVWPLGQPCKCIVMVQEDGTTSSDCVVVGTLDLSLGYLSYGEISPQENITVINGGASMIRYAYISNLCVATSARRRGIACSLLRFAILSAQEDGAEKVFVHVSRENKAAQVLYQNQGFQEVVVDASSHLRLHADDQTVSLLCLDPSTCSLADS
ncbi:uncharacterized protein LOC127263366 isoform X2 [Andrographis paniculata]|uniref:uncharacterized protein LOC127263366 isoform X2 n=1 Tax=Andrographis paniculata TaxID=175694 RepID=UPI0021E9982A|nr:uncharacterized protein LOC127263366 isoform X2 [Andrographis paniculata]